MGARISRDEVGLRLAQVWSLRGTCGRRRVGCVLMDAAGFQVGSGYNGPASGAQHCTADTPCAGFGAPSGMMLDACEAVHAEVNALIRCDRPRDIHTCYVTTSPCASCIKMLRNTPCQRIVFATLYATEHVALARDRWLSAGREWLHLPLNEEML